jgi:hypothetical protein
MLFDDARRDYEGPAFYAEPHFVYLNRSARPTAVRIRATLEEWFSHYPEGETKQDLEGRFRSRDDSQYRSSFFELLLHELLLQLSCNVEPHPQVEGTANRPDFLARPTAGTPFYLEAAVVSDESDEETAARSRINDIYDVLDRLDSANFFVGIEISGLPASTPPARQIRAFLERKLASVDADKITSIWKTEGFDAVPRWPFSDTNWQIEFYPIPKKPEARGKPGVRPLGAFMSSPQWIDSVSSLRRTLLEKAHRYGELALPYVIAVDDLAEFPMHSDEVCDALFQKGDGLWMGSSGPRYTRVSAVIISRVEAWGIAHAPVCLYHNPWARIPYDSCLTNLPQARLQKNAITWFGGKSLADLLHLPPTWPK